MRPIEVFIQGEGIADMAVVEAQPSQTVAEVVRGLPHYGVGAEANENLGGDHAEGRRIFLEDVHGQIDGDAVVEELLPIATSEEQVSGPLRLHVSRCRSVEVVVRFNNETAEREFSPSATIERVRRWAALRAFGMTPRDAAEHVLQLEGGTERPDRDVHVGVFVTSGRCTVAFDLIPSKRVEG